MKTVLQAALAGLIGFGSVVCLHGCVTAGAAQTPAQTVAAFCGPAQSILAVLKADAAIATSGQAVIAKAAPQVASICSMASTASSDSLQSLTTIVLNTVFPIAEATHPELVPDIIAAQAIIGIVKANIPAAPVPK